MSTPNSAAPAPLPPLPAALTRHEPLPPGYRIRVGYMNIRECADMLAFNPKLSIQDNLNNKVVAKLNEVPNLHRVISMNYTDTASMLRKNCALCTVWYETMEKLSDAESVARQ